MDSAPADQVRQEAGTVIYETRSDLAQQDQIMDAVRDWLECMPFVGGNGKGFHFRLIPSVEGEPAPDYEIWWNHLKCGVIEIKNRNKRYEEWMVSRQKLATLWGYNRKGIKAAIAFAHPEGVDLATMDSLLKHRDDWKEASTKMTETTDHGKRKRLADDRCYLLPPQAFWRIR
jgi:hypothetical protein